jgi:hypothetical protein
VQLFSHFKLLKISFCLVTVFFDPSENFPGNL